MKRLFINPSGHRGRRFSRNASLFVTSLMPLVVVSCAVEAAASGPRPITAYDLVSIKDIGGKNLTAINHRGALSVSPDGNHIAFQLQTPNVERRNYRLSWHILETRQAGRSWAVADGGELILNRSGAPAPSGSRPPVKAQWSPDSEWIYYLKRWHGSTQVWRSRVDGGATSQLTHHASDILSFQLSDDDAALLFTASIPEDALAKQLQLEGDRGFLYDERFQPHKRKAPYARVCGVNGIGYVQKVGIGRACEPTLWILDIPTKTERRASADEIETYRRRSAIAPLWLINSDGILLDARDDGSVIWVQNDNPKEFIGYLPPMHLFASQSGKEFRCSAEECRGHKGVFEGAWWRPRDNEVIFQRADGANGSMTGLYAWTPGSARIRTIVRTEDQLGDCKIFEAFAICLREQWTHPRTIVSIDLESGEIKSLYDPNPEFEGFKFSRIKTIQWEDAFGNPTYGHLVYPLDYEDGSRYPLVITTYDSRGFLRGAVGDEYPIHVLAANGFMVLSHDMPRAPAHYAFATGYFGEFKGNYERRSTLSAQETILNILDERGLIDPRRVAITGLSDGASQVMYALIHTNRFAAAIASSAVDLRSSYYSKNQKERAFWRRVLGGAPYEDDERIYQSMSLGLNAKEVNAPFLINVSDHELLDSTESFVRLQDAGRPVEMYVFPGEYHNKWRPQHRLAIYRRNVQWLKFWLMGQEEHNPVSPSQYIRWRKMRGQQCKRLRNEELPWYCTSRS